MSWLRRRADDPPVEQAVDRIRAAIVELTERRDEAAYAATAALLGQAEVQHALHEQQRRLRLALVQLDHALTLARRVADDVARDDGAVAALAYYANVDGLQVQRDVVVASVEQLEQIQNVSRSHVGAAREVLVRSRAVFDAALHEQLRLLVTLEQLERARLLLVARSTRRRGLQ